MANIPIEDLKAKFQTGDYPVQSDYEDLIDTLDPAQLQGSLDEYIPLTQKGNPGGIATLDNSGNVPLQQLGNIDTQAIIASIVDSAPTTLDTLNEIASALGDDANFAATIVNELSQKASINSPAINNPTLFINSTSGSFTASQIANNYGISGSIKIAKAANSGLPAYPLPIGTLVQFLNSTYNGQNIDSVVFSVIENGQDVSLEAKYIKLLAVNSEDYSTVDLWNTSVYGYGSLPLAMTFFELVQATISPAEVGYLDGVNSKIQPQIDSKFSTPPGSPEYGDVPYWAGNSWTFRKPIFTASTVSSNTTLTQNKKWMVVTSSSAITLTLPGGLLQSGDEIQIFDNSNNAGTNNITVLRNGQKINGLLEDAVIDVSGAAVSFVWVSGNIGWRMG